MSKLVVTPNIARPDEIYEALVNAHRGLGEAHSRLLNGRLILLLANHIGDEDILLQAIEQARLNPETASFVAF